MTEPTICPRTHDYMPGCVQALATVHAADRYPVNWPADPAGWLTPSGMLGAWVAVEGSAVLGHLVLARPGETLADAAGLPSERLVSVARFFVSVAARRHGVATRLLDKAIDIAAADGLRPVLQVEAGATAAIRLYERAGWRYVGTSADDWMTADGRVAQMRSYVAPSLPRTTEPDDAVMR
ncbi:GNAT family N-acetyltransferase [Streptomyces sp. NPDC006552]|uniref:GNAT family N-acetyltransferase n=1 Tax=Streptomyces sp. NPDC006552 TaxID=3157179 RepID=UPI0033BB9603